MDVALEAGAEDLDADDDGTLAVITPWEALGAVADALEAASLAPDHKEVAMVPSTLQDCDDAQAATLLRLIEALEELDDVQNVYSNARLPDGALRGEA